jgi:predicted DsbA family dithiol-disulfide isomerase
MTSSSHRGQRLQVLAARTKPSVELPLTMSLFEKYQIEGYAPSDISMLSTVAVEHGLFNTKEEATTWLEGDDLDKETKQGYRAAKEMGITGVPFFVFAGKYGTSGALPPDDFVEVSSYHGKADCSSWRRWSSGSHDALFPPV